MAEIEEAASNSRVIRVFLSSTFRDFMEERDLLSRCYRSYDAGP